MKRLASVFAVVSLALAGCGGSTCEELGDAFKNVAEKSKPCGDETSTSTDPYNVMMCDANFDRCSAAEKEAIADYASCLNNVDKCEASNPDAFDGDVLACIFSASGRLSDACEDAVFPSSLRPPAASYSIRR